MSEYCRQQDLAVSSFSAWVQAFRKRKPAFKPVIVKPPATFHAEPQEKQINNIIEIIADERIKIRLINPTNAMLIAHIAKELIKCS